MAKKAVNGKGRPPGVKNGEGTSLEPIKNWSPKHDLVVQLHVGMNSREEIGEMVGYTPQRVSQILNDPTARRLIRASQERLRENLSNEVDEGLAAICTRALEIVRETLEIEGLAIGSDFKKHQDRMALDVLKGRGHLSKDLDNQGNGKSQIPVMLAERIADALEKSNEAAEVARSEREIVVESKEKGDFAVVKT